MEEKAPTCTVENLSRVRGDNTDLHVPASLPQDSAEDSMPRGMASGAEIEEPDEIPWCKRVRETDYSGRNLEDIPLVVFDCSALSKLDVSKCAAVLAAAKLRAELGNLRMLKELSASHNSFWERQQPVDVSFLYGLRALDLSFNGMERFPTGLFRLKRMEMLDVSRNLLSIIPVDVKHLTSLKQLRMESNSISVLPDSIAWLESLEVLQAFDNHITHFEDQMAFPPKLRTLDLHSNRITSVKPSQFTRCTGLHNLNLSNNQIGHVDEQMFRWLLHSLLELHLANNRFPALPRSIGFLERLTVLDISGNKSLTSLPKSVGRLCSLAKLEASHCSLQALPRSIGRLKGLQKLLLRGNQLTDVPPTIGLLNQLSELDLSQNRLLKLPPTLILVLGNSSLEFNASGNDDIVSPPVSICDMGRAAVLDFLVKVPQTLQEMEEGWEVMDITPEEDQMLFDVSDQDLSWSGELQSSRLYSQFLMAAAAQPARLKPTPAAVDPSADITEDNGDAARGGWLSYLTSWLW